MDGLTKLQLFLLLSLMIFVIILAVRTLKIIRTPLHLRWEIMPIPHDKIRFGYGGSHYEELDYWTKTIKKSRAVEIKAMATEIFFIKSLFERNRQLWWFSYPFHLGLYILTGYLALQLGGAVIQAGNRPVTEGGLLDTLICISGYAGLTLAAIGATGLFVKRFTRIDLRQYSVPADYFNLLIWLAVLTTGLASALTGDHHFSGMRGFLAGFLTLTPVETANAAMFWHIVLSGVLLIYLPFTHMIHFMAKYFAYHTIRWADEPLKPGSEMQKTMNKQLGYKITWSAPHIVKDGNWADAATRAERDANGRA